MTTIENGSKSIVKVKLFGLFTEIIGKREITIMMSNGITVGNLKKKITEMYPSLGLANIPFVFAVNRRVASSVKQSVTGYKWPIANAYLKGLGLETSPSVVTTTFEQAKILRPGSVPLDYAF